MKLVKLILEDFTLSNEKDLKSPLVYNFGRKRLDYFFLNWNFKENLVKRIAGVKVYFGLIPNLPVRELTSGDLDIIYNELKHQRNISEDDIKKVIQGSAPYKNPYDLVISIPSSGKLNLTVSKIIKSLNPNKDCRVVSLEKAIYTVDAMVNQEKYDTSDPVTKKMVDTWMKRLVNLYGVEKELPIKVSPDPTTGHPGLQSGARTLLRNKFKEDLPFLLLKNMKILVVDDNLVSGDTVEQAFSLLQSKKVPKENLTGYVFSVKKLPGDYLSQLSADIQDPEKYRL